MSKVPQKQSHQLVICLCERLEYIHIIRKLIPKRRMSLVRAFSDVRPLLFFGGEFPRLPQYG